MGMDWAGSFFYNVLSPLAINRVLIARGNEKITFTAVRRATAHLGTKPDVAERRGATGAVEEQVR